MLGWGGGDFPMGIRLLSLCFNEVTVMTGCGRRFTAAVFIYGVLRAGKSMQEPRTSSLLAVKLDEYSFLSEFNI